MPGKVQAYVEMANETAASITQDAEAWMQFLRHSARFYKYSFNDQLLIYAQRPEATACASYEIWNNTMHRYIRRGSRGIALLSPTDNGMQLRYVFDVADTGELLHSHPVEIWRMEDRHTNAVNTALDNAFSPLGMNNLRDRLKMTRFVQEGHSTEEIAERLRAEFGGDLPSLPVMVNDVQREVPWTDAANALNRLVWDNQFYTEEEQEHLNDSNPVAVREDLTGDSIANDEAVDPEALELFLWKAPLSIDKVTGS